MSNDLILHISIVIGLIVVFLSSIKLIIYLRYKSTNTALWATIFEGFTSNAIVLEPLKEPEVHIEKQAKKDGQDKDPQS